LGELLKNPLLEFAAHAYTSITNEYFNAELSLVIDGFVDYFYLSLIDTVYGISKKFVENILESRLAGLNQQVCRAKTCIKT
jgi:hypothetical protein